jgi:hypothetical protein
VLSEAVNHLERAALEASGLVAVFPSTKQFFDGLRKWGQAAYLTVWFPVVLDLAQNAAPGTHWRLPPSFSGDRTSVVELRPLAQIEAERELKARQREAEQADRLRAAGHSGLSATADGEALDLTGDAPSD